MNHFIPYTINEIDTKMLALSALPQHHHDQAPLDSVASEREEN